jgi:hypothetical protein
MARRRLGLIILNPLIRSWLNVSAMCGPCFYPRFAPDGLVAPPFARPPRADSCEMSGCGARRSLPRNSMPRALRHFANSTCGWHVHRYMRRPYEHWKRTRLRWVWFDDVAAADAGAEPVPPERARWWQHARPLGPSHGRRSGRSWPHVHLPREIAAVVVATSRHPARRDARVRVRAGFGSGRGDRGVFRAG